VGIERENIGVSRVKLRFDAAAVDEALASALEAGLLCDVCTAKLQTRAVIGQNDFCSSCQTVIQMHLGLLVEPRLQVVLAENGLSPDAVKLMNQA
jgi:hypothetical protein